MAIEIRNAPVHGGPRNKGEEICHIVTEEEPDKALCGKDVTGWPWDPPWPMCVVCVDLAEGPLL